MSQYFGIAIHPFEPGTERELGFKIGDKILLFNWDDPEWWYGELQGRSGYFPSSHVELADANGNLLVDDDEEVPPPPPEEDYVPPPPSITEVATGAIPTAVGLWDCTAETAHELSFRAGDSLLILEETNEDWLFAELGGKRGYVPRNFVEISSKTASSRPGSAKPKRPDTSTLPRNLKDDPNQVVAVYDFPGTSDDLLSFKAGDFISVTSRDDKDWWEGEAHGKKGSFPKTYVDTPSPAAFELIDKHNKEDAIVTPPPVPQSKGSFISHNPNLSRGASLAGVEVVKSEKPAAATPTPTPTPAPVSAPAPASSAASTASSTAGKSAASSLAAKNAARAAGSSSSSPAKVPSKVCTKCKEAIPGAFMEADGLYYHKSCFTCAICKTMLRKFIEKDGQLYCSECFTSKVEVDPCSRCGKPLTAVVMKACGKRFHEECFVCHKCDRPFKNNIVTNRDGQPWCEYCVKIHTPVSKPTTRSLGAPSPRAKAAPVPAAGGRLKVITKEKKKFVSGFDDY